jgi:hypothetical protein
MIASMAGPKKQSLWQCRFGKHFTLPGSKSNILLIFFIAYLSLFVSSSAQGAAYTTDFPGTESPVSEGGKWTNGSAAGGNLWGNVQTSAGLAFGVSEPTQYGDPTAILKGAWTADQSAEAMIVNHLSSSGCCHEVEVRLRTTISVNKITGYEAYCSISSNAPYCHIASWGGPNGVYANLDGDGINPSCDTLYLKNNDKLGATVTGSSPVVVTLYVNGVQRCQVHDTGNDTFNGDGKKHGPWTSGNPGIGFYDNQDNNWNLFGFSHFSAQDAGGTIPVAPKNLRISTQQSQLTTMLYRSAEIFNLLLIKEVR